MSGTIHSTKFVFREITIPLHYRTTYLKKTKMAAAMGEMKETNNEDGDKAAYRGKACIKNHPDAHLVCVCFTPDTT